MKFRRKDALKVYGEEAVRNDEAEMIACYGWKQKEIYENLQAIAKICNMRPIDMFLPVGTMAVLVKSDKRLK